MAAIVAAAVGTGMRGLRPFRRVGWGGRGAAESSFIFLVVACWRRGGGLCDLLGGEALGLDRFLGGPLGGGRCRFLGLPIFLGAALLVF